MFKKMILITLCFFAFVNFGISQIPKTIMDCLVLDDTLHTYNGPSGPEFMSGNVVRSNYDSEILSVKIDSLDSIKVVISIFDGYMITADKRERIENPTRSLLLGVYVPDVDKTRSILTEYYEYITVRDFGYLRFKKGATLKLKIQKLIKQILKKRDNDINFISL
ncbi:MAG: hypothetical protein ABIA91_02175 [Patescibacteria group bacterium]